MEHGTDEEVEALRERWAAMERERALTDRLVYGAALFGVGVLLLTLSVPTVTCVHGGGVAGAACTTVESAAVVEAALVVSGVAALIAGSWLCLGVVRDRTHQGSVVFGVG